MGRRAEILQESRVSANVYDDAQYLGQYVDLGASRCIKCHVQRGVLTWKYAQDDDAVQPLHGQTWRPLVSTPPYACSSPIDPRAAVDTWCALFPVVFSVSTGPYIAVPHPWSFVLARWHVGLGVLHPSLAVFHHAGWRRILTPSDFYLLNYVQGVLQGIANALIFPIIVSPP